MSSFKDKQPDEGALAGQLSTKDPTFSQVEKVVMSLSPIFAIGAGWLSEIVARYFPGISIPKSQLIWAFVVGVAAVIVVVLKFLHSKDKRMTAFFSSAERSVQGDIAKLPDGLAYEQDVIKLLESHRTQLTSYFNTALADLEKKLPTAAADALRNLLANVNLGDLLSGKASLPPAADVQTGSGAAVSGTQSPVGTVS